MRAIRFAAPWAAAFVAVVAISACGPQPAQGAAISGPRSPAPTGNSGQPPGARPDTQLRAVALASPESGYGLFTRAAGERCAALSGYTSDGGAQFAGASVITSWDCAGNKPVTAIAADNAGDAFAYGPELYVKGHWVTGWRRSPQPGSVLALAAVGRSVWVLLAVCRGAAITPDGCVLRLMESADGGATWQPAPAQPAGAVTPGSASGPGLPGATAGQTWLLRTGPSAGYVLAGPPLPGAGAQSSAPPLWYTGDGAASWSRRHVDCGIGVLSDAVAAAPSGALAAVCASEPGAGEQVKTTAISTDGGLTWIVHAGCSIGPGCQDPLYSGYLGQIAAVSAQTIYLVGDRSSLLATTDGGTSWQPVTPLVGDGSAGSAQVLFFGPAVGVVVAAGEATNERWDIFHTFDGGRTWSMVAPRLS